MVPENPYQPFGIPAGSDPESPTPGVFAPLASPWSRLGARMLDNVLLLVLVVGVAMVAAVLEDVAAGPGTDVLVGVVLMACIGGWFAAQLYHLAVRGQTVGKRMLGLRIVDRTGRHPGWVQVVLARECSRYILGFVPYLGVVLGLTDTLMIFGNRHQTLHDRIAGTFVVHGEPEHDPAPVVDGAGGTAGVSAPIGIALVALGSVALVCMGSAMAVPNFVAMQLKSKRAELPANVESIREAELAYHARTGTYLAVSSEREAAGEMPGAAPRPWRGGSGWDELGWSPDGDVRGAYWVELTATGFVAFGLADIDGDGEPSIYAATESQLATLEASEDVY